MENVNRSRFKSCLAYTNEPKKGGSMEIKKENVLKVIFKNVRGWYIESEDKSGAILDLGKRRRK